MARRPLSMRKAKEILRLRYELGLTHRQIARSCEVSHVTVGAYLRRAEATGLRWPLPPEMNETALEQLLAPAAKTASRPMPPMEQLRQELSRRGVTLRLLWEEYHATHPEGYGYTQFCARYRRWRQQLEPSLRQPHQAGEKLFVDWAGQTVPLWDAATGLCRPAYIFLATLGASNYTYAEAFDNMRQTAWSVGHINAFAFMGGVPKILVPDNTKTGVLKACRYEPELNPAYQELAAHYGTVVIPARARKPTDKAKVEAAVQHVERRILAPLRDQKFFSLGELNAAIRQRLEEVNRQPFQKLAGSRHELFVQLDQPALLPLPGQPYEPATWRKAQVNIDYHVQVDWHLYSVPYQLVHREVEVRLTEKTVELFLAGQRVAAHPRSSVKGGCTTEPAHRPKAHQHHLEWTPSRLIAWAGTIGPHCGQAVTQIMADKPHPEMGYRACLGIIRLSRCYGRERLEAACRRALDRQVCSYRSIQSILAHRLDQQAPPAPVSTAPAIQHTNLRGAAYYN